MAAYFVDDLIAMVLLSMKTVLAQQSAVAKKQSAPTAAVLMPAAELQSMQEKLRELAIENVHLRDENRGLAHRFAAATFAPRSPFEEQQIVAVWRQNHDVYRDLEKSRASCGQLERMIEDYETEYEALHRELVATKTEMGETLDDALALRAKLKDVEEENEELVACVHKMHHKHVDELNAKDRECLLLHVQLEDLSTDLESDKNDQRENFELVYEQYELQRQALCQEVTELKAERSELLDELADAETEIERADELNRRLAARIASLEALVNEYKASRREVKARVLDEAIAAMVRYAEHVERECWTDRSVRRSAHRAGKRTTSTDELSTASSTTDDSESLESLED
uniref:Uncharacterized protein n=1 Tax=Globisporangium ultimum (strain ATCC 200006 / CBS 805.95 / DAOM BR144) TaxID=431595 RepID=K3XAY8_GLOUD